MPLLDFAYTSSLTFNFCVMADIANLARHLLMAEVLQICESVHKKVEELQLTVYQKGDVHTVVSSQPAHQPAFTEDSGGAYMVTIQSDGQAVVTHTSMALTGGSLDVVTPTGEAFTGEPVALVPEAVEGEAGQAVAVVAHSGEAEQDETVTLVTHTGQAGPGESMTLISRNGEGMAGETMTVVTHSGQAGASESLAVVSACLAMEQPQDGESPMETGSFMINVDPDNVTPSEVVQLAAAMAPIPEVEASPQEMKSESQMVDSTPQPELQPTPQKRKRGRPAKVKKEITEEEAMPVEEEEEMEMPQPLDTDVEESPGDRQEDTGYDPYKRRLRQPTMGKGGYARLHLGLEEEEEDKKELTTPKVLYIYTFK